MEVEMKEQSSSKGFAVLSSASIICKVLSLVYLPIQILLVKDSGNGVISIGFKLYLFIYALTNAGLPVVISKFVSEQVALGDYRSANKTFRSASVLMLSFGVISTLFTYFAAGWLAVKWSNSPDSLLMLQVIAPTFLFTSVSCSLRGYFQGRRNMTPTAVSQIIEQIINSALTVAFEVLMYNYAVGIKAKPNVIDKYVAAGSAAATALAALGSALFLCFVFFVVFRRQRRHEIKHQVYDGPVVETSYIYRQILKFAIPALISCVAVSAIDLIDTKSCIGLMMQGGIAKDGVDGAEWLFGIYSTKYQRLMTLATMFVAPLVTAMIPALATSLANNNHRYFRYKIRESYKLIYIVVMPVIAGLTFLAHPIITVMFTRMNEGSLMVVLGTWTALLMAAQSIQSGILIALNKPLVSPINLIIGMIAKLLCNYILIPLPSINIYGALIGNTLAWIISILLNRYFINRALNRKQHTSRYMIVPGFASVIMGALCLGLFEGLYLLLKITIHKYLVSNDVAVFVTIPFGALVYMTLMIKTGGIKAKDIFKLPMGKKLYSFLIKISFLRSSLVS
jgi:stage V sporulation protein B